MLPTYIQLPRIYLYIIALIPVLPVTPVLSRAVYFVPLNVNSYVGYKTGMWISFQ